MSSSAPVPKDAEQVVRLASDKNAPVANPTTATSEKTSPPLFEVAGAVNPGDKTATATMPQREETRGRHKATCTCDKCKAKKASAKKTGKKTQDEGVPDYIQAAALYNAVLVGACKLISDEYEQGEEMQAATMKAACDYFEATDIVMPPWAGLLIISLVNVGAAMKTPKGRSKLGSMWNGVKAWYIKRRG